MKDQKKYIALVVEDEPPLAYAIKTKLEKMGFDAVTTRTVEQASAYMEDIGGFDFVWLDHYLIGQQTGLDFVEKLKASGKWKDIPIFVVSNTASSQRVQSYLDLGVTKYYTKSNFRLDAIIDDIRKYLEDHEK
ncbi:MAG: hypothetical protein A3C85_03745 [Candidatus Doudnabacteria bacterium RIFCSPHIGHO2_02_FULL_48_21]|uniref:Response regulatory domain-containing protein n=1 Tax=Candidatus Doudnabacteria bacterium RIFCSPLOWO2_02_FULL_48_13 TaxID=1817845 RepID=A0A1F5QC38_9BACT|nr:MAG: hypothetical protein A3K05_03240 [Candidatus Doudnabacteria bacterium RIFCSPHIGHO2_01_48_18]OGE79622.1 MAG: hypothetical protein A2668_01360 [Candidatus Doudnabacteria bacterium RIFCSPHIGHO2_01_FULL_48_180]OGE91757.1 MAG: hypothetical protein A3F44_00085 [Candidatus Doudnabacteria bacterium RIFCSPHIGHO2_12_FULL_47_25]OGE93570.1 MAG: hypothetical protein A3C85_03745 [Candidatus Doudnabacteria bacterium RIFCSPHIGHO2_02_FULL_48_21]OGE96335.1 MAG: hypothetical protein A3A83_00200 [Candidatu